MFYNKDTLWKRIPTTYGERKRVAREICAAISFFNDLHPMMDKYFYNDGIMKDLMSLSGTIPIIFQGGKYNIPVQLWLEENYPFHPPICYVTPTREMVIMRSRYLTSNGQIQLPYIQEWKRTKCDLFSLIQVMSMTFGEVPPVCSRPGAEPYRATCLQQRHGISHVSLTTEDGLSFQQELESNC